MSSTYCRDTSVSSLISQQRAACGTVCLKKFGLQKRLEKGLRNEWPRRYDVCSDAMLDDFDKGFWSFANQMSSSMAKISLFVIPLKTGCTPPILTNTIWNVDQQWSRHSQARFCQADHLPFSLSNINAISIFIVKPLAGKIIKRQDVSLADSYMNRPQRIA